MKSRKTQLAASLLSAVLLVAGAVGLWSVQSGRLLSSADNPLPGQKRVTLDFTGKGDLPISAENNLAQEADIGLFPNAGGQLLLTADGSGTKDITNQVPNLDNWPLVDNTGAVTTQATANIQSDGPNQPLFVELTSDVATQVIPSSGRQESVALQGDISGLPVKTGYLLEVQFRVRSGKAIFGLLGSGTDVVYSDQFTLGGGVKKVALLWTKTSQPKQIILGLVGGGGKVDIFSVKLIQPTVAQAATTTIGGANVDRFTRLVTKEEFGVTLPNGSFEKPIGGTEGLGNWEVQTRGVALTDSGQPPPPPTITTPPPPPGGGTGGTVTPPPPPDINTPPPPPSGGTTTAGTTSTTDTTTTTTTTSTTDYPTFPPTTDTPPAPPSSYRPNSAVAYAAGNDAMPQLDKTTYQSGENITFNFTNQTGSKIPFLYVAVFPASLVTGTDSSITSTWLTTNWKSQVWSTQIVNSYTDGSGGLANGDHYGKTWNQKSAFSGRQVPAGNYTAVYYMTTTAGLDQVYGAALANFAISSNLPQTKSYNRTDNPGFQTNGNKSLYLVGTNMPTASESGKNTPLDLLYQNVTFSNGVDYTLTADLYVTSGQAILGVGVANALDKGLTSDPIAASTKFQTITLAIPASQVASLAPNLIFVATTNGAGAFVVDNVRLTTNASPSAGQNNSYIAYQVKTSLTDANWDQVTPSAVLRPHSPIDLGTDIAPVGNKYMRVSILFFGQDPQLVPALSTLSVDFQEVQAATVPTLAAIAISPTSYSGAVGSTQDFTAAATDTQGNAVTTGLTISWSVNDASIASLSNSTSAQTTLTALKEGKTTLSVQATNVNGSVTASVPITVTVTGSGNGGGSGGGGSGGGGGGGSGGGDGGIIIPVINPGEGVTTTGAGGAPVTSTGKLAATGGSLIVNLIVAAVLAAITTWFIFRRKPNQTAPPRTTQFPPPTPAAPTQTNV